MNSLLWAMQILVAIVFLGAGLMKTCTSRQKIQQKIPSPLWSIRLIGSFEMLGAIGLIFPLLLNVYPFLTAIAGICLSMVMLGATILHIGKKEHEVLPLVVMLLILCSTISICRY